jgi:hypothetical protein
MVDLSSSLCKRLPEGTTSNPIIGWKTGWSHGCLQEGAAAPSQLFFSKVLAMAIEDGHL